MSTGCLFCNIVAGTIPAQLVLENDHVVAFKDIRPVAPSHALVIPKKHLAGIHDATPEDARVLGHVLLAARDVAEKVGLAEAGYRLVINQGAGRRAERLPPALPRDRGATDGVAAGSRIAQGSEGRRRSTAPSSTSSCTIARTTATGILACRAMASAGDEPSTNIRTKACSSSSGRAMSSS